MVLWIGSLVTLTLLLYGLHKQQAYHRIHSLWRASFRGDFRKQLDRPVRSPVSRLADEAKLVNMSVSQLWLVGISIFVVTTLVVTLLGYPFFVGMLFGVAAGFLTVRAIVKWLYRQQQNQFRRALFSEALPIAAQTLKAVNRLEDAFHDVAATSRHPRVRREYTDLSRLWKKQNLTPAEAFHRAAKEWEVDEMADLALITKESEVYHPDYSSLFTEYGIQIETDMQYSRMLKAKTAAARRNAMTFLGLVFVIFFLGYPKLSEFLTDASRIAFFATIGIITVGGFAIWRAGEKIEV